MFKNNYHTNSSELSISSNSIKDCNHVAGFFQKIGIMCSVTENITVVEQNNEFIMEKGCRIKMGSHKPEIINSDLWNQLKNEYNLKCAHLEVEGKYRGCIINYLRDSNCPGLFISIYFSIIVSF